MRMLENLAQGLLPAAVALGATFSLSLLSACSMCVSELRGAVVKRSVATALESTGWIQG